MFKRLITGAGWVADSLLWILSAPLFRVFSRRNNETDLTIGITTFKDRFDDCLKPLVKKISILFPDNQVIVIANGHIQQEEQASYLEKLEKFCRGFKNVEMIKYKDPVGLSVMWNTVIRQSRNPKIMLLNDDIRIKAGFRMFIRNSGITGAGIATVNASWSHFVIGKDIVGVAGWFDEGLKEIGGEDDDYLARLALAGVNVGNYETMTIARKNRRGKGEMRVNSYGKDMSVQRGGYSTLNTEYLESKWEISKTPIEGGVVVPQRGNTYWRLKKDISKG